MLCWYDIQIIDFDSSQITLGEMVSVLPVSGGFVTLANRCLSPGIVVTQC